MGLLEDLIDGKYNLIFFAILFVFIFHQYWHKRKEDMSDTLTMTQVISAIKQYYVADVESIRNLSNIATQLQSGGLTIPGDLTVKGNIKTPANLTVSGAFNMIPKGTIFAFNSDIVPEGWALCDGKEGRPNLMGRFLVGYSIDKEDYNKIGKTGGEEKHKLTLKEMPRHDHDEAGEHRHKYVDRGNTSGSVEGNRRDRANNTSGTYDTEPAGKHKHKVEGGDEPHENRPPYYVVNYIIKL
jgi:microcystin-dependent protein